MKENRPRINHFEVFRQLAGLEEKCRIYNNDEVADALHTRAQELSSHPNKYAPELLSLLLCLSGNPLVSSVKELDELKHAASPPPLTWNEILCDDPLDDNDGTWDTIDYGEDSFDDDDDSSIAKFPLQADSTSELSDASGENLQYSPRIRTIILDYNLVDEIERCQEKLNESALDTSIDKGREPILETQLVKETLLMLHGLPTRIFVESEAGFINIRTSVRIIDVSNETTKHLLDMFAQIGGGLGTIRRFAHKHERVPLVQTFQASLLSRLQVVDRELSSTESQILDNPGLPMTLMGALARIQSITRFIMPLAEILTSREAEKDANHFEILEVLYDKVCLSQSIGDGAYRYLADIFFESLQTFMKPVRRWMETGEIEEDDKIFFVRRTKVRCAPESLWSKQFELLQNENGKLYAPRFLHLAAKKVLTSGKSVNMLRALSQDLPPTQDEIPLTFASVCEKVEADGLSPFSELLGNSFEAWIASKHHLSSYRLRETLISDCGLWANLDALEFIYFARNGSLQAQVARNVFNKLDRGKRWDDHWALSNLLQETYGRLNVVESGRLSVKILEGSQSQRNPRSIHRLGSIIVHYSLPWTVGTIIKPNSLSIYQRISVVLMQIQRAKLLLDGQIMTMAHTCPMHKLILYLRRCLRWYVEILYSHLTTTLSDSTINVRRNLEEADDLDAMIVAHESYIKKLAYSCLLAEEQSSTHQAMISLLDLVVVFSDTCDSIVKITSGKRPASKAGHQELEASSSEEDEESVDAGTEFSKSDSDELFAKLRGLLPTYSKLLDFVLAGVRDASRIGDTYLNILVDNLDYGVR